MADQEGRPAGNADDTVQWLTTVYSNMMEQRLNTYLHRLNEAQEAFDHNTSTLKTELQSHLLNGFNQFYRLIREQSHVSLMLNKEIAALRKEMSELRLKIGLPDYIGDAPQVLPNTTKPLPEPPFEERVQRFVDTIKVLATEYGVDVYRSGMLRNCHHVDYPKAPISPKSLSALAYTYFRGNTWKEICDWALKS